MNTHERFEHFHRPIESTMSGFTGATGWLNSEPIALAALRDKVVLVHFGTFTCINWIRTLPYIRAWRDRYRQLGLVTVGVQTPEFGIEHDANRIARGLRDLRVDFPVAIDNDFTNLDRVRQPVLARAVHRRRKRVHPAPPFRRRRLRAVRARHSAPANGRGSNRDAGGSRIDRCPGPRGASRLAQRAFSRNLRRVRAVGRISIA